jgi:hypothetical protein
LVWSPRPPQRRLAKRLAEASPPGRRGDRPGDGERRRPRARREPPKRARWPPRLPVGHSRPTSGSGPGFRSTTARTAISGQISGNWPAHRLGCCCSAWSSNCAPAYCRRRPSSNGSAKPRCAP